MSFTISPRELTPLRAKVADNGAIVLAIGAAIYGFMILQASPMTPDSYYWIPVIGPMVALPLIRKVLRHLLKRSWKMVITADQFKVEKWYGWKKYDRQLPHKFSILVHDKTKLEQEKIELDLRKGKQKDKTYSQLCYYGNSFHISYEYLGQRNDIATVFGHKQALALVTRLQACDDVMGDGTPLTPDDQWGDRPGDIDD